MYRILCGIEYLHNRFIMHRDLKTANILCNTDCSIKIWDFSLSRSMQGLNIAEFDFSVWLRKNSSINVSLDISSSFLSLCTLCEINCPSLNVESGIYDFENMTEKSELLVVKNEENMSEESSSQENEEEEDLDEGIGTREHMALDTKAEFLFNNTKTLKKVRKTSAPQFNVEKKLDVRGMLNIKISSEISIRNTDMEEESKMEKLKSPSLPSTFLQENKDKDKLIKKQLNRILLEEAGKEDKKDKELTGHMSTRWYRAPELILVEKIYTTATDVWSLGCIFAELLQMLQGNQPNFSHRKPLFPGHSCFPLSPDVSPYNKLEGTATSENDQLNIILQKMGSPTESDIGFITDCKAIEYINNFPKYEGISLKKLFPKTEESGISLLKKMLKYNPYKRIIVKDALRHPYFKEVRNKQLEVIGDPLPLMIDEAIKKKIKMKDITICEILITSLFSNIYKSKWGEKG